MIKLSKDTIKFITSTILFIVSLVVLLTASLFIMLEYSKHIAIMQNYSNELPIISTDEDVMYDGISVVVLNENNVEERVPLTKLHIVALDGLKPYTYYTDCLVYKPLELFGFKFMYPLQMDYVVSSELISEESNFSTVITDYYATIDSFGDQLNKFNNILVFMYNVLSMSGYMEFTVATLYFASGLSLLMVIKSFINICKYIYYIITDIKKLILGDGMDDIERDILYHMIERDYE